MSVWKQIALSIAILLAAFVGWASFFPGLPKFSPAGASTGPTRQRRRPTATRPRAPARPGPRHPAHHRGNRPGRHGHDQRPPAGDRHRPRQRHRDGQPLHVRPPDGIPGAVRRAYRKRPGYCHGSIPRPRRSRWNAPRSRATMRRPRSSACRALRQVERGHRGAADRSRARAAQRRAVGPRRASGARSPFGDFADRRRRRHPADRGRQLRHQPVGDRHRRRPLLDPRRFLGARAFCRRRQGRRRDLRRRRSPTRRKTISGTVSAVDNRIDDKSRTLWVQARIANPADSLRAGMSFQVGDAVCRRDLSGRQPAGVLWGADGAFVWTVEDGKVKRVPVRIIQRNTETVLVDAPIASGEMVVTEGVQSVRQGSEVRIAGRDGAARPPKPADRDGLRHDRIQRQKQPNPA